MQKGIGDIMGGALIETEARTILKQGKNEAKREMALRILKWGKLTIAEVSGLRVAEVEELAELQTV